MSFKKRLVVGAGGAAAAVGASVASAAIDVSGIVTEIGTGAAPIAAIGGAVLLILAGVKLWKLLRRSM